MDNTVIITRDQKHSRNGCLVFVLFAALIGGGVWFYNNFAFRLIDGYRQNNAVEEEKANNFLTEEIRFFVSENARSDYETYLQIATEITALEQELANIAISPENEKKIFILKEKMIKSSIAKLDIIRKISDIYIASNQNGTVENQSRISTNSARAQAQKETLPVGSSTVRRISPLDSVPEKIEESRLGGEHVQKILPEDSATPLAVPPNKSRGKEKTIQPLSPGAEVEVGESERYDSKPKIRPLEETF